MEAKFVNDRSHTIFVHTLPVAISNLESHASSNLDRQAIEVLLKMTRGEEIWTRNEVPVQLFKLSNNLKLRVAGGNN